MLILILIDVQYSKKAVFSFEKGWNCQNHSCPGSLHPVKKSEYGTSEWSGAPRKYLAKNVKILNRSIRTILLKQKYDKAVLEKNNNIF